MNWKDWLLPWRAKAKIEQLQACLNRSADAAPFTAKIALLEDRLEQTTKSLKAALDEKHVCATLLSSTRASEQDWRETASKVDLEKNELASLNRTLVDQLEHAKADVEEWKGKVKTERKQREDMEVALGKVEAELHEAHALAAKASELQEALENEVKEHREAKQQLQGLTKWIRTTHRLDTVAPKGSIRNLLQTGRFKASLGLVALLCMAGTVFGQAPFWRNSWSTNQAPPVIGTNLGVSNTASGFMWKFYAWPSSNTVARLMDITNAFTGLSASTTNFNGINVTNRALIGDLEATNSANTTNLTNWGMQVWKSKNNLGTFDDVELDVSTGLAEPSWTLGYANIQPTIRGQVVVGNGNDVNGGNSTVLGISNYVSSTKTHIVVGSFSQAWGGNDGVVGHNSFVTNANNYAFGNNITNITPYSVCIGPHDTNKVRISWLGLDSLNLPVVGTNNTNFGNLAFPPQNTAVSTSSLAGAWNFYSSNGIFNIMQPCGGAGLMGTQLKTNDGGLLVIQTLDASLGTMKFYTGGSEKMRLTSLGRLGIGTNAPSYTLHLNGSEAIGGFFNGASTNPLQLSFIEYQTVTNWPSIVMNGPSALMGIGPGATAGNVLRIGACTGPGTYWPTWGTVLINLIVDGYVGIGTNNPQARLHVVAPGTATNQYVFRVSSSNAGVQAISPVTSDTNNVFRVGSVPLSIGQQVGVYGAMMFNNTNYGQAFGTTAYTNIVGFNIWNTNQFNVNTNTGYLTNKFAGYYRCMINVSMIGVNSGIYEGCMRTNDVDPETIAFKHQHDNPARLRSASGCGVIYLPAGTGCSFSMKCDVAGAIQIHRGSITIGTP